MSRLSFHTRALLAFVGLTLLALIGASTAMYFAATRTGFGLAELQLRTANRIVDETLDSKDREFRYAISAIATDDGLRQALGSRDRGMIRSALENQRKRIGADVFAVLDADGAVISSHSSRAADLSPVMLREAFAHDRSKGGPLLLRVPDGRLIQIVVTSVKSSDLIGWICAGVAVDDDFLRQIKTTVGTDLSLIQVGNDSSTYEVAASTLPTPARMALSHLSAQPLDDSKTASPLRLGADAFLTFFAVHDGEQARFAVVSQLPLIDVLAPVVALRRQMLILGGVVTVICLVAAMLGARLLAQPVRALAHAARSLSSSKRRGATGAGNDELAQVARAFHALARRAHYDGLTGLPNRTLLKERLTESLQRMKREAQCLAVVFIDLNGFKTINDTLGHEMGDLVLRKTAQRLLRTVCAPNTVARLGGDEFVLLLEDMNQAEAVRAVEGLASVVATPMVSPSGPINVGMSAGIAIYPIVARSGEELLQLADEAMYQSKTRKKGPVIAQRNLDLAAAEVHIKPDPTTPENTELGPDATVTEAAWAGRDLATQDTRALELMMAVPRSVRAAPIPADEKERLQALRRLRFLDMPPRANLDRITRMTAKTLNVPIALVSLVDEHRQWFMSRVGIRALQTPREVSFCAHAVFNREPLIVPDSHRDERFSGNPLVIGEPGIRAYAGVPLYSTDGRALGTLCVCDRLVRQFREKEIAVLQDFGHVVEEMFRLREFSLAYRQRRKHRVPSVLEK